MTHALVGYAAATALDITNQSKVPVPCNPCTNEKRACRTIRVGIGAKRLIADIMRDPVLVFADWVGMTSLYDVFGR